MTENNEYGKMEWTVEMVDKLCQVLYPKYTIRRTEDYVWIQKDFLHIAVVGIFFSTYSERHVPIVRKKRDVVENMDVTISVPIYHLIADLVINTIRKFCYFVIDSTDGGFFEDVDNKINEFVQNPQKEVLEKMETLQDSPKGKWYYNYRI